MRIVLVLVFCLYTIATTFAQTPKENFNQGITSLQQGNLNDAIKCFSRVVAKRNDINDKYLVADAYVLRGECKVGLGNYAGALEDAKAAVELKPKYHKGYRLMARAQYMNGKTELALSAIDTAIKFRPQDEELYNVSAQYLADLYRLDDALARLNTALEINPVYAQAYITMGTVYEMKKDYPKAVKAMNSVLKIEPNHIASLANRGAYRAFMRDFDSAQIDMLRATELDSTLRYATYNNIAYFIKFEQQDYKGAIEYFTKAIALEPKFPNAYNNRGYAWYKLGNYKEAVKDMKQSLDYNAKNSYAYKNLALVAIAEGKQKQACEYLVKANDLGYTREHDNEVNELLNKNCK